ncbi:hypothetical protein [Virgisporangium aurantiacum]|uniref:Uncharacterized protein n=1 Tax=Virgisporangium aurantiacum TaxID=175570 RepID=A0A8J4E9R6_9ACTN|nr:hypothetical protein [Virgisporangium aurantiacum]GIJ64017.1 hypothetical protein Vau01_115330 [Virgisporangium aurantiacum]
MVSSSRADQVAVVVSVLAGIVGVGVWAGPPATGRTGQVRAIHTGEATAAVQRQYAELDGSRGDPAVTACLQMTADSLEPDNHHRHLEVGRRIESVYVWLDGADHALPERPDR